VSDASDTNGAEPLEDLSARWLRAVAEALGIDDRALVDDAAAATILDLARDAAHGVARPAAPLAAYAVGLAVGRGATLAGSVGTVTDLASHWG
jgi:hypothetical protein